MNAMLELYNHIGCVGAGVKWVEIQYIPKRFVDPVPDRVIVSGKLHNALAKLDFNYDDGYGAQKLYGVIWFEDGTWSDRAEYDGSEWWEHRSMPELPSMPDLPKEARKYENAYLETLPTNDA